METGARKKPLAFVQNYVSTYPLAAEPRVSSIRGGMSDDCWTQSAMQRYERTKKGESTGISEMLRDTLKVVFKGQRGFGIRGAPNWKFLNFPLFRISSCESSRALGPLTSESASLRHTIVHESQGTIAARTIALFAICRVARGDITIMNKVGQVEGTMGLSMPSYPCGNAR